MKEIQYLDLILNGILKNERFLKNYIIRKQKEAENKNFISEAEFFENCHETVSFLENKFEAQFIEKRRKMHDSIELLKKSNKPFKEEMDLVESFKLERLNINLSEITNGKYKDDLWYSQIKLLRENIFEIIIKKHITTFEIKDLDIYNYLDFVFSKKSISRESKKKAVLNLMDGSNQEKIISNFRIWIDYVFNQQNYWKELTEVDKKSFEELRTKSLEEMNALFENYIKGSPKPRVVLKKEFEITIIERLCKEPFQETTSDLMEGCLPKDINKLAIVIGKLDFIIKSHKPKIIKVREEPYKKELSLKAIALKCFYEKKVLNRESAKKELEGTSYISNDKLYTHFSKWSNNTDRKAYPESKLKLKNKIEIFEIVIESLSPKNRENAIKDLNILKGYLTKY
jgi:hypothetical protein